MLRQAWTKGVWAVGVNMTAIHAPMAMAPGRQKRCLLVLGMHNSGTSLLSNLMHGAGVPLGPHLLLRDRMPEERRPRYDYYEDADIVQLQDQTLLDLQRHWSSYRASWPLPPAYHPSRERFRQRLQGLIQERLRHDPLWLVKDPRSAVLLEDWLLVLRQLNVQPRLLLVHRDPASNIRSFSQKGKVPQLWAEALWQRTYQQALLAIRSLPEECWAITRFENLLQQPQKAVFELCRWLEHPTNSKQRDQLAARVDQALPSFPPEPGSDQGSGDGLIHAATRALSDQLQTQHRGAPPTALLSDELQEALVDSATSLELNLLHPNGQTLLPKATVTIVSKAVHGGMAEDASEEGGVGSEDRALASALATAGHRVTVLLIGEATAVEATELAGVKVHHLQGSDDNQLLLRMARWLQKHPCDVVHLQHWPDLITDLRKALQPQPPQLIVSLKDGDEEKALQLKDLQQANGLISASPAMAAWAQQKRRPEKNWTIELSVQALHERLPRRVPESASDNADDAKTTAETADEASAPSTWRRLIKRIKRIQRT